MVATGRTAGTGYTLPQLVKAMEALFCQKGTITIHASSAEETIFSVTDDQDACFTYDMLTASDHAEVQGAIIKFRQWKPTDELGFDVAEERIRISIANLPLQLWSPDAVDHILSRYCALEYVTDATRSRTDLLNYKCIAWAQHRIPIPSSILVCIPVTTPDGEQPMESQPHRRMLTYRINLVLQHYIHGDVAAEAYVPVTHVPRYEQGYSTDDAICYMPPGLVDQEFLQQLSNSVITTCTAKQAQAMCNEIYSIHPTIDVQTITIQTISSTQQLMLLPGDKEGTSMQQKMLSTPLSTVTQMQPWSPAAGSIEETLHVCARLIVRRIPAHFCTAKLMHLFLGGCAYMEVPDRNAERLITCETYRCIVWCRDVAKIPDNLLVKAVSANVASALVLHPDQDVTVRTANMLIEVQHTASSIQDLLSM
ncbi:hypothetical protein ACQ4PT_070046 [Festuca glaucescens]